MFGGLRSAAAAIHLLSWWLSEGPTCGPGTEGQMGTVATWEFGGVSTRDTVFSQNYGAVLTVCQISYGKVSIESVLAGEAEAQVVYMSADGRSFVTSEWATGDENCGDAVYVEVRRAAGRDFHGWVDAESRKLVQAG